MKIGIVPSIQEKYKNQFEYSCDVKLTELLLSIFRNCEVELLTVNHKIDNKFKLIIISGASGNDLISFNKSKKNIMRNKLDNKFFNLSQKFNIPILGICHGAQYLAKKFSSVLKKKEHVGNHYIRFNDNNKKFIVNSYHTKIITKLGRELIPQAQAYDNSIEYFKHQKRKIIGIMWHPERFKKTKKIDINIIRTLCS
jgi:gamma-glutamyl-gamma-aminobutyrate hydrolase PuuD